MCAIKDISCPLAMAQHVRFFLPVQWPAKPGVDQRTGAKRVLVKFYWGMGRAVHYGFDFPPSRHAPEAGVAHMMRQVFRSLKHIASSGLMSMETHAAHAGCKNMKVVRWLWLNICKYLMFASGRLRLA